MRNLPPTKSHTLRRIAAAALALWLGGVYCLFCSALGVATVAASEQEISCAGHACCHLKKGAGDEAKAISSADVTTCCAPVRQAAVLTEKRSILKGSAATLAVKPSSFAPQTFVDKTSFVSRLHVPDRGGTYLRCCLFLI